MKKYRFQIQNCIDVEVEAENDVEARIELIDHLDRYADQMVADCCVSDGVELK